MLIAAARLVKLARAGVVTPFELPNHRGLPASPVLSWETDAGGDHAGHVQRPDPLRPFADQERRLGELLGVPYLSCYLEEMAFGLKDCMCAFEKRIQELEREVPRK